MKICPRCEKTYPDSESFCETDGSALIAKGPAFAAPGGGSSAGGKVECPVCGGQAEPGEVICNFCGTRLVPEEPYKLEQPPPRVEQQTQRMAATQVHRPQEPPPPGPSPRRSRGNRRLALIGYAAAAILALFAGIYMALHLTPHKPAKLVSEATPSAIATPPVAIAQPMVALANAIPLQVVTTVGAPSPDRTEASARGKFDDNKPALLDAYKQVLSANPGASDGMMVRIRVLPDGTIDSAAIRTSTSPNPELDARVVKSMMGWTFAPTSGPEAEIDYPVIFVPNESERAKVESALQTKVASLSPSEAPEYAASKAPPTPAASPSPAIAAVPTPAPTPPPVVRRAPRVAPRRTRKEELAAIPKPTPSLFERVKQTLKSNPKLRRVHAYTANGTVTLYGKVFDNNDRLLAERVVRSIPGVTGVVNTVTTDTAQWKAEEAQIQQQLVNAGLPNVTVKVIGSDAYLSGSVKTALERERAVTIAEGAAPVTVRSNIISVEPGSIFGF